MGENTGWRASDVGDGGGGASHRQLVEFSLRRPVRRPEKFGAVCRSRRPTPARHSSRPAASSSSSSSSSICYYSEHVAAGHQLANCKTACLLPTNRRGNAVLFGLNSSRALIGWKQTDLAQAAGLSEMSVKNIVRGVTDSRMSPMQAIRSAFEAAGGNFIDENGEGPGVRLRKKG
ncbi:hypothetical protein [Sinorhizobium fredii]|uniref:hypothetical protein n=1 Tax=Rhizobium fredii TaxID=380 RepID=UPI001F0B4BC1|nr:hypothetical protein [Sinorhizobium fredii]